MAAAGLYERDRVCGGLWSPVNHYGILSVAPGSSLSDIKSAYHRALLRFHPDKNVASAKLSRRTIDIASIQEAYRVLSTPSLRSQYDLLLQQSRTPAGPRPAQVISLEEFQEHGDLDSWSHSCRCGGVYKITEEEMDRGQHLIPCTSCSEIVWVGYEPAGE
ncbi:DnaJ domain-containing protein [Mycena crocata]|nr:DnaJ domain-containing protein [Mycena crocata]